MKIVYSEFITHARAELDLSATREQCGAVMAEAYCKQYNKRKTARVLEYFSRDCGLYHAVRDLIEDIKTEDFNQVLATFKAIYPQLSEDWKSALKCGLLIKAERREGNYINRPHIYHTPEAIEIRKRGLNNLQPFINNLFTARSLQQAELFN